MKLRPYQQTMLDAMQSSTKGYVTCGTGGGKTFVIINDCRRFLTSGNVIVIVAPQLLLSEQLFNEFDKHLSDIDFVYLQVSSENKVWERDPRNLKNPVKVQPRFPSTVIDDIQHTYDVAQKAQQPLILFTTYKSLERIDAAKIPVTAVYFDEAHNCCTRDAFPEVSKISASAENVYFFTATPCRSRSATGAGMQNVTVYGENIANVKYGELVECGAIVPPHIHLQYSNVEHRDLDEVSADVKTLQETIQHYEKEHSQFKAHKVLVACRGTANIQGMQSMVSWANSLHYDLLTVDSVNGGYLNGTQISIPSSKGKFLAKLNEMGADPDRKMIVLHYDMLGEGIDVKAFTATLFIRPILSNIKAIQAMGRVIRAFPGKEYGIVTVVKHADDSDDAIKCITDIVNQLRTQGVPLEEMLIETTCRGKDEEIIENLNEDLKKRLLQYEIEWQHSSIIEELLSSGNPLDILG